MTERFLSLQKEMSLSFQNLLHFPNHLTIRSRKDTDIILSLHLRKLQNTCSFTLRNMGNILLKNWNCAYNFVTMIITMLSFSRRDTQDCWTWFLCAISPRINRNAMKNITYMCELDSHRWEKKMLIVITCHADTKVKRFVLRLVVQAICRRCLSY